MFSVVLIALGGWYKEQDAKGRAAVADMLKVGGRLENLLEGVPAAEAEEFRRDLHLLGLV